MCNSEYDVNAPIWQTMPKTDFKLLPTDVLEQVCVYDTSAQTMPTPFGEKSNEEMCASGLKFYPKLPDFSSSPQTGAGAGLGAQTSTLTDHKHMGAMVWKYKDYDREPDHQVFFCVSSLNLLLQLNLLPTKCAIPHAGSVTMIGSVSDGTDACAPKQMPIPDWYVTFQFSSAEE